MSYMQKNLLLALCIIWLSSCMFCSETIRLKPETFETEKPKGCAIQGIAPRPVLFIQTVERKKMWDKHNRTVFYVFDPARPDLNLQKVFSGPGEHQSVEFITPLFGWCGLAEGSADSQRAVEFGTGMTIFWYNLLTGEKGNSVPLSTVSSPWIYNTELRFLGTEHICRYDLGKDNFTCSRIILSSEHDLDGNKLIALSSSSDRIIRIDIDKSEAVVLSPTPKMNRTSKKWDFGKRPRIYPAGPCARDGIYYTRNWSLWWKPPQEQWISVIRNVYTDMSFRPIPPSLDTIYVGNGRFAVRRSLRNSLYTPKQMRKKEKEKYVLSVIMLTDGRTGEILEETDPLFAHVSDYRAFVPRIPEKWWAEDMKPGKKLSEQYYRYFKWDAKKKILNYGSGKSLRADDRKTVMCISGDGRYLVLYKVWCIKKTPPSSLSFRIVDGKTGKDKTFTVTADTKFLYVSGLRWENLWPETFDEKYLKEFRPCEHNPFDEDRLDIPKFHKTDKINTRCP